MALANDKSVNALVEEPNMRRQTTHRITKQRVARGLNVLSCFIVIAVVVLTIVLLNTEPNSQDMTTDDDDDRETEICVECSKLDANSRSSSQRDAPFDDILVSRMDNGVQMCCAQTVEQLSTLFELVKRKRQHRKNPTPSRDTSFRFTPVSAHLQLHPTAYEKTLKEPEFNDERNILLLDPTKMDPLLEHVNGVDVRNDSLVIKYPGLYYVYTNIQFKPVSDRPPKDFLHQNWFVYLYKIPVLRSNSYVQLSKIAHTVCDNCISDQDTSFVGGSFYLEAGERIQVCSLSLGVIQFRKDTTYLGLMMLASGSKETEL
uniref:THD domain-containing protein n=1 Tax=Arion vulgaris TaxID=1028688 RepID=A0A0B7BLR4_9EUPU